MPSVNSKLFSPFEQFKCKSYVKDRKLKIYRQCHYYNIKGSDFCKEHTQHYKGLISIMETKDIMGLKMCSGCDRHFLGDNDIWTLCLKCQDKNGKHYCKGITKEGYPCSITSETDYCTKHLHFKDLVMATAHKCSDCKRTLNKSEFIDENGEFKKLCSTCRARGKNRIKDKDNRIICVAKIRDGPTWRNCSYQATDGEKYCLNHYDKWTIKENIESKGNKVCSNFPRCSQEILSIDIFSTCSTCRLYDQEKSKCSRNEKNEAINMIVLGDNESICRICLEIFEIFETKSGNVSTLCKSHYDHYCSIEDGRGTRNRNWTEELRNNPERASKKQEWKELNWDKVIGYWQSYRERQKELKGIDNYRKECAEKMMIWRKNNPEKMDQLNKLKKKDPHNRYLSLINQANKKNCLWKLDEDYALKMIGSHCFYCDEKNEGICNSLDKLYDTGHYTPDNSVSCCKICNYMKKEYSIFFFLDKATNILQFMKESFEDSLELFLDDFGESLINTKTDSDNTCIKTKGVSRNMYTVYKYNAQKRNINFCLTEDEFNEITNKPCYICSYKGTDIRPNGLDRYNNKLGYEFENGRSCCTVCNYFKRDHDFNFFINHLEKLFLRKNVILQNFFIIKQNPDLKFYDLSEEELEILRKSIDKNKVVSMYNEDVENRDKIISNQAKNRKLIPLIKKKENFAVKSPDDNDNPKIITVIKSSNKPLSPKERKEKSKQLEIALIGEANSKKKSTLQTTKSRQKDKIIILESIIKNEQLTPKELNKINKKINKKKQVMMKCKEEITKIDELKAKAQLQQV